MTVIINCEFRSYLKMEVKGGRGEVMF